MIIKITNVNKVMRALWALAYLLLYRPSPIFMHKWRVFLLRIFGAKIESSCHPYPKAKIWAPWNLVMKEASCIANYVDCYNVALVEIGKKSIVSQYSFLCTASHNYNSKSFDLIASPIVIGDQSWVAAGVFVAPGVNISSRVVVYAKSVVLHNLKPGFVYGGYPARSIKRLEVDE